MWPSHDGQGRKKTRSGNPEDVRPRSQGVPKISVATHTPRAPGRPRKIPDWCGSTWEFQVQGVVVFQGCSLAGTCDLGNYSMLRNNAGRKSAFRAGFWPDCYRESTDIGRRADFEAFPVAVRPKIQLGRPICGPEALLRNIEYTGDPEDNLAGFVGVRF